MMSVSIFYRYFLASWLSYFVLATLSYGFRLYEYFPAIGFVGYGLVISLLLAALNYSSSKSHYLLVGAGLVIFGAIASLDIVLSSQEIAQLWMQWELVPLTREHIEGYMQIIIILLNIFTGSLAANSLFYGLNKKNFES